MCTNVLASKEFMKVIVTLLKILQQKWCWQSALCCVVVFLIFSFLCYFCNIGSYLLLNYHHILFCQLKLNNPLLIHKIQFTDRYNTHLLIKHIRIYCLLLPTVFFTFCRYTLNIHDNTLTILLLIQNIILTNKQLIANFFVCLYINIRHFWHLYFSYIYLV